MSIVAFLLQRIFANGRVYLKSNENFKRRWLAYVLLKFGTVQATQLQEPPGRCGSHTNGQSHMKFLGVTILQGVEFPIFLLIFAWTLQQCSATALPVINMTVAGKLVPHLAALLGDSRINFRSIYIGHFTVKGHSRQQTIFKLNISSWWTFFVQMHPNRCMSLQHNSWLHVPINVLVAFAWITVCRWNKLKQHWSEIDV